MATSRLANPTYETEPTDVQQVETYVVRLERLGHSRTVGMLRQFLARPTGVT